MNFSVTHLVCHIGYLIFPVGNVMLRIHVPWEKGHKEICLERFVSVFSTPMKSVCVTHGAIMPFSNSQGSAAAWSFDFLFDFLFAKESMAF